MRTLRRLLPVLCWGLSWCLAYGQDLSGTWTGSLITQSRNAGLAITSRLTWELVQEGAEVFGIVYFYPQDTHTGDLPNTVYTWSGKMNTQAGQPFHFIQGRWVEGLGSNNVYLFRVNYAMNDSVQILQGAWFSQLEALHTRERPNGFFTLARCSNGVSNPLWKQHEKETVCSKSLRLFQKGSPTDDSPR